MLNSVQQYMICKPVSRSTTGFVVVVTSCHTLLLREISEKQKTNIQERPTVETEFGTGVQEQQYSSGMPEGHETPRTATSIIYKVVYTAAVC